MRPLLKKLLIAIAVLLVIGAVALVLSWLGVRSPDSRLPNSFPIATSTGPQVEETIQIPLRDGSVVAAKDFVHNGTTIEDPANDGNYYLSGSSGYCYADGTCPSAAVSDDYNIVYFSQDRAFVIGLAREPLGESRREAERYLMNALGLTQQQMCALNYMVSTTVYVNSTYGSMGNLGFSFCPGSVKLP